MKVILAEYIEKLGSMGDMKNVSDGYARNYLFPKGLAMPATESNMAKIKNQAESQKKAREAEMKKLEDFAAKLAGSSVNITVEVGEGGKMFGSVTKEDVTAAIARDAGMEIDKHDVLLPEAFKEPGVYTVDVKLKSEKFKGEVTKTAKVTLAITAPRMPKMTKTGMAFALMWISAPHIPIPIKRILTMTASVTPATTAPQ
jgi:large subunit ribosomal protein L9